MEDISFLTTVISSFGFPICACIAMGWYISKNNAEHREEIKELNEKHSDEVKGFSTAINNNTIALEKLTTLISSKEGFKNE